MRTRLPTMTESADALHQRLKQAKDPKKRQRWQARYRVARGHARYRQEVADRLGVHRPRVAACLAA